MVSIRYTNLEYFYYKSIQLVNDRIPGASGIGRQKQNFGFEGERNQIVSANSKQQARILPKPVTPQKLSCKYFVFFQHSNSISIQTNK